MGVQVSSYLEDNDDVSLNHFGEEPNDFGGMTPESVHVHIGDVTLWGPPDRVAVELDEALTRVQAVIDGEEE